MNAAGWELSILRADIRALERTAETLGRELGDWDGKRIREHGSPKAMLGVGFTELDDGGDGSEVLRQVVDALSATSGYDSSGRGIPSTEIAGRVNEYLAASGSWFPPIVDLCNATGVSERRLRSAFIDCYDMPPSHYLRRRALSAVHKSLRRPPSEWGSVASIAYAHGFRHLSDFARYYRQVYGVLPSETLRSNGS
jgi:AraC-like DNA-binding protein